MKAKLTITLIVDTNDASLIPEFLHEVIVQAPSPYTWRGPFMNHDSVMTIEESFYRIEEYNKVEEKKAS